MCRWWTFERYGRYFRGMSAQDQFVQLSSLPEHVRKQVLEFIEFLLQRDSREAGPPQRPLMKQRPIGKFKGMIHMADDFDAPLDDFKDYM